VGGYGAEVVGAEAGVDEYWDWRTGTGIGRCSEEGECMGKVVLEECGREWRRAAGLEGSEETLLEVEYQHAPRKASKHF